MIPNCHQLIYAKQWATIWWQWLPLPMDGLFSLFLCLRRYRARTLKVSTSIQLSMDLCLGQMQCIRAILYYRNNEQCHFPISSIIWNIGTSTMPQNANGAVSNGIRNIQFPRSTMKKQRRTGHFGKMEISKRMEVAVCVVMCCTVRYRA